MFRIFSKKNGKTHPLPDAPSREEQESADSAIKLALEACDNNLMLARTAKKANRKVRSVLDDLVLPIPATAKK